MIYINIVCWVIAILSLVYAVFHLYLFGEVALWYWNVIKAIYSWLKSFNK